MIELQVIHKTTGEKRTIKATLQQTCHSLAINAVSSMRLSAEQAQNWTVWINEKTRLEGKQSARSAGVDKHSTLAIYETQRAGAEEKKRQRRPPSRWLTFRGNGWTYSTNLDIPITILQPKKKDQQLQQQQPQQQQQQEDERNSAEGRVPTHTDSSGDNDEDEATFNGYGLLSPRSDQPSPFAYGAAAFPTIAEANASAPSKEARKRKAATLPMAGAAKEAALLQAAERVRQRNQTQAFKASSLAAAPPMANASSAAGGVAQAAELGRQKAKGVSQPETTQSAKPNDRLLQVTLGPSRQPMSLGPAVGDDARPSQSPSKAEPMRAANEKRNSVKNSDVQAQAVARRQAEMPVDAMTVTYPSQGRAYGKRKAEMPVDTMTVTYPGQGRAYGRSQRRSRVARLLRSRRRRLQQEFDEQMAFPEVLRQAPVLDLYVLAFCCSFCRPSRSKHQRTLCLKCLFRFRVQLAISYLPWRSPTRLDKFQVVPGLSIIRFRPYVH